jgi:hypothetical protein
MSSLLVSKLARSPRLAVLQVQNIAPASQSAKNPAAVQVFAFVTLPGIEPGLTA